MLKEKTKDRAAAYNQFGILYIVVLDILFFFFFSLRWLVPQPGTWGKII